MLLGGEILQVVAVYQKQKKCLTINVGKAAKKSNIAGQEKQAKFGA